jgi:predicted enzyme related to lactoylglutathione lyase
VDIGVADIGKATAFYSSLFGWTVLPGPPETGGYSVCEIGGRPVAGIGPKMSPEDAPAAWVTYIATENASETAERIKAAGGQLLMEPMAVMDLGTMALATDPAGALFGLWQAGTHTGAQVVAEPGSLAWNENWSRSLADNKAFYHALFGYAYGDINDADIKYATLDLGGRPVGGIGEMGETFPAQARAYWGTYFAVEDADTAVAKVTDLGGTVIAPPWDTPYGRMASVLDDQGASFSVMRLAQQGGG